MLKWRENVVTAKCLLYRVKLVGIGGQDTGTEVVNSQLHTPASQQSTHWLCVAHTPRSRIASQALLLLWVFSDSTAHFISWDSSSSFPFSAEKGARYLKTPFISASDYFSWLDLEKPISEDGEAGSWLRRGAQIHRPVWNFPGRA